MSMGTYIFISASFLVSSCGTCCKQSGLGTGFPQSTFSFLLSLSSHQCPILVD